jgi:hypothetical protein
LKAFFSIKLPDNIMLEQKLTYLHMNPLQAHWNLVSTPMVIITLLAYSMNEVTASFLAVGLA